MPASDCSDLEFIEGDSEVNLLQKEVHVRGTALSKCCQIMQEPLNSSFQKTPAKIMGQQSGMLTFPHEEEKCFSLLQSPVFFFNTLNVMTNSAFYQEARSMSSHPVCISYTWSMFPEEILSSLRININGRWGCIFHRALRPDAFRSFTRICISIQAQKLCLKEFILRK